MPAVMQFRVRRGWNGACVLQQLIDSPTYNSGRVDSSVREYVWVDVNYDKAPTMWQPVKSPTESQTDEA